jgi:hypothetical protein
MDYPVCRLSVHGSVRDFFYINADTCELGFQHLSAPASEGGGGLGGSTENMVEQYLFFLGSLRSVSVVWWGGLFQWS